MNRRTLLAGTGVVFSAPLAGCMSGYQDWLGVAGTNSVEPDDDMETGIGTCSLTVFHHPDRSPDEIEPSLPSTATVFDHPLFQTLFDEAVETGRATYSTRDTDEADALGAVVSDIPADADSDRQYVIHRGEVLHVRMLCLH